LAKIFDPYFTTKPEGRGLGLASAHSIIAQHGGHIGVESELGVGSTLSILLPVADSMAVSSETELPKPKAGAGKVLVMEDDSRVAKALVRILESLGYECKVALDGAKALELYITALNGGNSFGAVILDLTVAGGMGGKEAIAKLLELDPNVKAIVSSGYSNDPILADYEKSGFLGVLAKPYGVQAVSAVVSGAIANGAS